MTIDANSNIKQILGLLVKISVKVLLQHDRLLVMAVLFCNYKCFYYLRAWAECFSDGNKTFVFYCSLSC